VYVCPRCGQGSTVEQLEATPESTWLLCRACRYVWRGPGQDAFAFIVCSRALGAQPVREPHPSTGKPRAPRFAVTLPMRYRTPSDASWHPAVTENISRSGVLFRTDRPPSLRTAVEIVLEVPSLVPGAAPGDIVCLGDVVREQAAAEGAAVAVAVGSYRLKGATP
jgi:hypothetical protein